MTCDLNMLARTDKLRVALVLSEIKGNRKLTCLSCLSSIVSCYSTVIILSPLVFFVSGVRGVFLHPSDWHDVI